jgi:hypothetical protein
MQDLIAIIIAPVIIAIGTFSHVTPAIHVHTTSRQRYVELLGGGKWIIKWRWMLCDEILQLLLVFLSIYLLILLLVRG